MPNGMRIRSKLLMTKLAKPTMANSMRKNNSKATVNIPGRTVILTSAFGKKTYITEKEPGPAAMAKATLVNGRMASVRDMEKARKNLANAMLVNGKKIRCLVKVLVSSFTLMMASTRARSRMEHVTEMV